MVTAMVTVKFSSAVLLPVASYHFCCTSAFLLLPSLQLLLFFLLILLLLLFRSSFCSFSLSFPASDAVAKYKPNSCSSVLCSPRRMVAKRNEVCVFECECHGVRVCVSLAV